MFEAKLEEENEQIARLEKSGKPKIAEMDTEYYISIKFGDIILSQFCSFDCTHELIICDFLSHQCL